MVDKKVTPATPTPLPGGIPGWAIPAAIVAIVVAAGGLYWAQVLPETWTGLLLALMVPAVAVGYVLHAFWRSATQAWERAATLAASVLVLGLTLAPAISTIMPGEPLAQGELRQVGDAVALPTGDSRRVRLLLHGSIAGTGAAEVEFTLSGTIEKLEGTLRRTLSTSRAGRRGYTTVTKVHNTEYLSAVLPSQATKLTLDRIEGPLLGELRVQVFPEWWPLSVELILACLALLGITALALRQGLSLSLGSVAGLSLAFGVLVHVFATPDAVVRPEIGALILATLVGSTAGAVCFWLGRRLAGRWLSRPA